MMSCSKLLNIFCHEGAVSSCGSTIDVVRAAVPVGFWTASSRAASLIGSTLLLGSHLHELLLLGNKGTVSSSGSTVDVVRAAVPVGIGATSSWARGLIGSTLLLGSHLHELLLLGNKGAVSSIPILLRKFQCYTFSSKLSQISLLRMFLSLGSDLLVHDMESKSISSSLDLGDHVSNLLDAINLFSKELSLKIVTEVCVSLVITSLV